MKKLAAAFFILLFASTASAQVILQPSTNSRMDGLGVANWQVEDDFNIWMNPAQISNYKNNVYGELGLYTACSQPSSSIACPNQDGIQSGTQWGGMNMDVSYGTWGLYIGRPYSAPLFNSAAANPLGVSGWGLGGPLYLMNLDLSGGTSPSNNRVDLFYGLHSAQPLGFYLSYADQEQKNTTGGVTTKDNSSEWNLGAGGIFMSGMLEGSLNITIPTSKCNDPAGFTVNCGFLGPNQTKSDAGPSVALFVRHHANMGNSKLLSSVQVMSIDGSSKDTSGTGFKTDDTAVAWRLDTTLNAKPIPDALVLAGIGIAGSNEEVKFNQGGGKITFDNLAIPLNVAVEHQTLKSLKTRFGLTKPLYNSAKCKDTTPGGGSCPIFIGGNDKTTTVSDGAATASLGLGWAVMDNFMIDAVINQDIVFSGTYVISGVAESLSSKISATYRFD